VAKRKLIPNVEFRGRVSNDLIPSLLLQSDLLVLPSREEALGVAAIEALSAGVPVVASRIGGLPEVLNDPVCGELCDPNEPSILAATIQSVVAKRLSSDEVLRRAKTMTRFSVDRLKSDLERLYLQHPVN
jgi:glycosyltransferase involved in cell wall biosynthesis